jgi:hypothetical protein
LAAGNFNIAIMRAFVQLRKMIASNEELARKLDELEEKYDEQFRIVFDAIHALAESVGRLIHVDQFCLSRIPNPQFAICPPSLCCPLSAASCLLFF